MNDVTSLIKNLIDITEASSDLNRQLDELKAQKAEVQRELIDQLKLSGLQAASAHGKLARIVSKVNYSIMDPDEFLNLDDKYHTASLYTVNSNKLNAFCKDITELNDGELPIDIAKTLQGYQYDTISLVKAK